jgi:hypothetical protein
MNVTKANGEVLPFDAEKIRGSSGTTLSRRSCGVADPEDDILLRLVQRSGH